MASSVKDIPLPEVERPTWPALSVWKPANSAINKVCAPVRYAPGA